jgi:hypothetical protein
MSKKRILDPIALLRESICDKRKITLKSKFLCFGQTRVEIDTKTGKNMRFYNLLSMKAKNFM